MRVSAAFALLALLFCGTAIAFPQPDTLSEASFLAHADSVLMKLVQMQQEIKEIHPYLSIRHPIAIVENDELYVFDNDSSLGHYTFRKKDPVPFPMPKGIRASFPLSTYGGKPSCVVSLEVFDEPKGYATVFHEFIHCAQYQTVEPELKQQLEVARQADREKNYSWEINYSFPYQDSTFANDYNSFLLTLKEGSGKEIERSAHALKVHLAKTDYEYMVWEEWKEGFARFIENKVRARLGVTPNQGGSDLPYNRVTFYYGGEMFIGYLVGRDERLLTGMKELFGRMLAGEE